MQSASSRYVIVFNGEVYNHRDIRSALEKQAKAPAQGGDLDALLPTMGARRFDLVLATDTLIYYGELQPVLRLIAARLADDGLAAVSLERLP